MLATMTCVMVVVTFSAVAVRQSLESVSATAQACKAAQTIDAAQAGIQAEINNVKAVSSVPVPPTPTRWPAPWGHRLLR
jgi:hypothetical protein